VGTPEHKLLGHILERISDAVVALDADWNYVYVNQKAAELLGRSKPEDLIGRHIWTEYPEGIGQPFQLAYDRAMETQELQIIEEYYQPWNRWFENRIYPSPDGLTIYFHEITEVKLAYLALEASERLNRLLIDHMVDVLWVLDLDSGKFTYVSPSVEGLRGYTPAEVLKQGIEEALTPEGMALLTEYLPVRLAAIASGETSRLSEVNEVDQPCKDGSVVHTEVVTTIRSKESGGFEVIGVTRDITARKRAEEELGLYREHLEELVRERTEQLEEANRELEEANRIKSEFLARMSHELRTPLNSVIGFADVMLLGMTGEISEEQKRQLGMIARSGRELLDLINDILDLSKVEAGRIEVEPTPFDVRDLVDDIAESLRAQAEGKGVALEVSLPPGPVTMVSDKRMIRQILVNLVGNAVKFTEQGSVTLAVRKRDGTMEFVVTDTGCGIAEENLPRVFDEFWQLRGPRDPNLSGTGLGLAISQRLARLLGGTLGVESTLGEGASFALTVPRVYSGADASE
jgi:PAS domain S-box-containing protein